MAHSFLVRRLDHRRLIWLDALAAAVYTLVLVTFTGQPNGDGAAVPLSVEFLIAMATGIPLAARRLWPVPVFSLVFALSVASVLLHTTHDSFVGAAFALYLVALTQPRRRWVPTAAIGILSVVVLLGAAVVGPRDGPAEQIAPIGLGLALLGGAWTFGRAVRERRAYAERSAAQIAARAVTDERMRIARELHDVVAHSMSLITVKAGVANHVADERPEEARDALRVIETTSRAALAEMRQLLGVLRTESAPSSATPGDHASGGERSADAHPAPVPEPAWTGLQQGPGLTALPMSGQGASGETDPGRGSSDYGSSDRWPSAHGASAQGGTDREASDCGSSGGRTAGRLDPAQGPSNRASSGQRGSGPADSELGASEREGSEREGFGRADSGQGASGQGASGQEDSAQWGAAQGRAGRGDAGRGASDQGESDQRGPGLEVSAQGASGRSGLGQEGSNRAGFEGGGSGRPDLGGRASGCGGFGSVAGSDPGGGLEQGRAERASDSKVQEMVLGEGASGSGGVTVAGAGAVRSGRPAAEILPLLVTPGDREARQVADEGMLAPAPNLGGIRRLVDQAAMAGVRVDLELEAGVLPEGVALSAYRIVQEALTNVVKHAAPAQCRVVIVADGREVRISVVDDGPGARTLPDQHSDGPGHGLIGMRERVMMYGGEFSAGPRPEGGFAVTACLHYDAPEGTQ